MSSYQKDHIFEENEMEYFKNACKCDYVSLRCSESCSNSFITFRKFGRHQQYPVRLNEFYLFFIFLNLKFIYAKIYCVRMFNSIYCLCYSYSYIRIFVKTKRSEDGKYARFKLNYLNYGKQKYRI